MTAIEPIIFDLKDGSLKRVSKSKYVRNTRQMAESMYTEDVQLDEQESRTKPWHESTNTNMRAPHSLRKI